METISIAVAGTVIGAVLSYLTFKRSSDNAIRAETREAANNSTKLEYIAKGVDDIRIDIKAQDRKINSINGRLIRVEESTKSAHKRMDEYEKEGV